MGLDWSTFLLEVVNFLILVWILKRLLYAPVKAAIERRRKKVEGVLAEAEARRAEADRLHAEYQARQQDWERERAAAQAELEREIKSERDRHIEQVEREIAQRREQARIVDERHHQETEQHAQVQALQLAAVFGTKFLTRFADRTLESRLVSMVVEDLESLDDDYGKALAAAARDAECGVHVSSAYPLATDQRDAIMSALSGAAGTEVDCTFDEDPDLIAGLRIDAGALVMRANLRDELRFFAEAPQ